ncbi:MAG: hypothetical protein IAE91_02770 [Ignavibacteriaceae bacterium]|nr:hypothetical protein [Ignavibacteriaceae bacterium]
MKTVVSIPLFISFIVVVVLFLLFIGAAAIMTLTNKEFQGSIQINEIFDVISFLWVSALVFLILSTLLGWSIFTGRNSER